LPIAASLTSFFNQLAPTSGAIFKSEATSPIAPTPTGAARRQRNTGDAAAQSLENHPVTFF
jgi:hypothetical protein